MESFTNTTIYLETESFPKNLMSRFIIIALLIGITISLITACQKQGEGNSPKSESPKTSQSEQKSQKEYGQGKAQAATSSQRGPKKNTKKTNVRVNAVGTEPLKIESTFVGHLLPNERVRMTSEMDGVIETINFEEADEVKKGKKLINISTKELTLRLKISETDLKLAETNLKRDEKLEARKLIPKSQLDQRLTQADRSRLNRDLAMINLRKSFISSPLKGTVKIRHVKVGEFVRKGDPLVEILDLDKVLVKVNIPEQEIMEIREGENVEVELYALSDRQFLGTVKTIGLEADSRSRTFPVEIMVDNQKRELRPGMLARVTFSKKISDEQIVVPRHTILERDNGRVVFLVDQDKAVKRMISTGQSLQDRVQVMEGLNVGDLLVVEGHTKLTDGEPIRILK